MWDLIGSSKIDVEKRPHASGMNGKLKMLSQPRISFQDDVLKFERASTPPRSNPLHSTPLHSTPPRFTPIHSTQLQSTPPQSNPLQSTPLYSTPRVSTPLLSTPRVSTPINTTTPHSHSNQLHSQPVSQPASQPSSQHFCDYRASVLFTGPKPRARLPFCLLVVSMHFFLVSCKSLDFFPTLRNSHSVPTNCMVDACLHFRNLDFMCVAHIVSIKPIQVASCDTTSTTALGCGGCARDSNSC